MAIIVSTGTVARVEDDTAGTQFAYRNNEYAAIGHPVGNFSKIGNSIIAQLRMSMIPSVPAGALITDARLEVIADTSQAGLFFTVFRTLIDDGVWNAAQPLGPQYSRASRPPINIDFRLKVESTASSSVFNDTLTFNGAGWEMRANASPGRHERIGQGFTPSSTVNLGFITWKLSRNNAPSGNIWVELYSSDVNGLADTLLATSNTRSATSPPTGVLGLDRRFTFPAGQQPSIVAGTIYVAVLRGDYPINGSAFVKAQWEGQTGGNAPGWPSFYGSSIGFDDQAYPVDSDFHGIPVNVESVVVVIPAVVAGQVYNPAANPGSGSLKEMMQAHINRVAYTEGDPIGIRWEASLFLLDANDRRDFRSPGAKLIIEWDDTPNTAPTVTITAPSTGFVETEGVAVLFTGTASDPEDGDLTAVIAWTSAVDGSIGTGGSFSIDTLSPGVHLITATVTDSGSLFDVDTITIRIAGLKLTGESNGDALVLSASARDALVLSVPVTDAIKASVLARIALESSAVSSPALALSATVKECGEAEITGESNGAALGLSARSGDALVLSAEVTDALDLSSVAKSELELTAEVKSAIVTTVKVRDC